MSLTEELSERAIVALGDLAQQRTFEEARAALNEAGIVAARRRVFDGLDRIEAAQARVRAARQLEQLRAEAVDQAMAAAEWGLDSRFVKEGAKTFLVDGDERRAMTADERKQWKQAEARKDPAVVDARALYAGAELELATCKDELVVAEKAFSAARGDLDAAIATVTTLAASIKKDARP